MVDRRLIKGYNLIGIYLQLIKFLNYHTRKLMKSRQVKYREKYIEIPQKKLLRCLTISLGILTVAFFFYYTIFIMACIFLIIVDAYFTWIFSQQWEKYYDKKSLIIIKIFFVVIGIVLAASLHLLIGGKL